MTFDYRLEDTRFDGPDRLEDICCSSCGDLLSDEKQSDPEVWDAVLEDYGALCDTCEVDPDVNGAL